ncbi:MAG: hypothetical protein EYC70_15800 [Planctomycetota bacterium]|nr:MAG: hypothetical protein EYC70_15800 [Planctomycetota bacterium]
MAEDTSVWFCILDRERGRLLEGRYVPNGRLHLDERARLDNPWTEMRIGGAIVPRKRHKDGLRFARNEQGDKDLRFGREACAWIERELVARRIALLHLFCPPHFLGVLRHTGGGKLLARVTEHEADLAHLSAGELAAHRAIVQAMEAALER